MVGGSVSGLRSLRRHARVLSFAAKVQWSPGENNKLWRRLWYSTRPWIVVGQAFHVMLSVLQTSISLRTLQLVYVEVKPPHQLVILSIPTLKSLILDDAYFVPTAIEMPRSSITSLRLTHGGRRAPVEYTLELLRNTLETLEVGNMSVDIPLILETMHLPRLTCLTHTGIRSGFTGFIPRASNTITKPYITTCSSPFPLVISDGLFPQLRELFSPWWIGVRLVPGRPVQVFHDIEVRDAGLNELQTDLALLSHSTRGIEELQMYTSNPIPLLLQLLDTQIPQLRRLHLWTTRDWSFWLELLYSKEELIGRNLNVLAEIHFGFMCTQWSTRYLKNWRTRRKCLQIFPALEVVQLSVGVTRSEARKGIPPIWNLSLRRINTGEWEEFM